MAYLKKILVTGAGGFIGSHLVEELIKRGFSIRAFIRYNSLNSLGWLEQSAKEIKSSIDFHFGDIRDPISVKKSMIGCDAVLHLAAIISIPYSYESPDSFIDTNIKGTMNILQCALETGLAKIVHTSTSEVYGTANFVPITEIHPLQAQSPYAASKIGADQLALSFFHSYKIPVSIIRPFNTYGPRQSARAIIPTIITQIIAKRTKIRLGALHPTRDFNYVRDTVNGFISVLLSERSIGKVFNIGSNYEISIGDLVKLISEIMNVPVHIETDSSRLRPDSSEVGRLWADNSRAKEILGWKPEYQGYEGLKRGLHETIQWFNNAKFRPFYKPSIYNI